MNLLTSFFWFLAFLFVAGLLVGAILSVRRGDREVFEFREREPVDVRLPVRKRPRLYDYEETGDFG